jgi:hypothetical protein
MKKWLAILGLVLFLVLVLYNPTPSYAQNVEVTLLACPTILNSLHSDWQATRELFRRYGAQAEMNPVIRAIGPDIYFATWTIGVAALCKENSTWRYASVIIWAVQTWAVGTHYPLG